MQPDSVAKDMAFLDREFTAVIWRHFQVRLGHDLQSVARLDALFAQSPLRQIALEDFRNVSVMLAAYLGETVRALSGGGRWSLDDRLGPCVVEVPNVAGAWRVLARAEKRIRSQAEALLLPFVARAVAQKS
jgi:hypothetical protein